MLGWGGVTSEDPIFAAVPVRETDHGIETFDDVTDPAVETYESEFVAQTPIYVEV